MAQPGGLQSGGLELSKLLILPSPGDVPLRFITQASAQPPASQPLFFDVLLFLSLCCFAGSGLL